MFPTSLSCGIPTSVPQAQTLIITTNKGAFLKKYGCSTQSHWPRRPFQALFYFKKVTTSKGKVPKVNL